MHTFLRTILAIGAVVLTCLGLSQSRQKWSEASAGEVANFASTPKDLAEEEARSQALDALHQQMQLHFQAKREVLNSLLANHCGLWEAADEFRRLADDLPTNNREAFRRTYTGSSDSERYCLQVIATVEFYTESLQLSSDPICTRLRGELQEYFDAQALAGGP